MIPMLTADQGSAPFGTVDEELLTRLFDTALDAVIGMDAQGSIIAWNRQAEAMFGWSREEAPVGAAARRA